ncbi:hypothetical protein B4O97_17080 [Marispirochaeta aestuarii]|uniref:Uncharacterized protein n=1 Tax=Marispirochaeta aestuarii TaxID=1963862 RepID=A0A1Y1RTW3_9SPIO|nr:hypothetical protein [Marispirochaeta aestuarii]ORC31226.1 hypothetical protein B4O97_17080 [Marispirochaeta aestuarii]
MRSSSRRGDEGFSYMETIAALFIAAISASALAVLVLGLFRAPFTIRSGSRESASVALLDRELRLMAARIQGPWWTEGPDMALFPESLTVNWLDGVRENTLHLEIGSGELRVNCGGELSRLSFPVTWTPRFEGANQEAEGGFRLLLDTEGRLPEICVVFGTHSLMEDSR